MPHDKYSGTTCGSDFSFLQSGSEEPIKLIATKDVTRATPAPPEISTGSLVDNYSISSLVNASFVFTADHHFCPLVFFPVP